MCPFRRDPSRSSCAINTSPSKHGGPVWESVQRARNFAVYAPAELLNPQMELIILLAQPV
jgi:hypothetical protein